MYAMFLLALAVFCRVSGLMAPTTKTSANVDMSRFDHLEAELHSTMSVLQLTIYDLQSTKRDLQATKTGLQTTITRLASTEQELNSTKTDLQITKLELNATKEKLDAKTKDIAFQAYITKNMATTGKYQVLKFDGVNYNAGNGYNTTTGKFMAPVSGTYFFSAQAEIYMKGTTQGMTLMILQGSHYISGSYGETTSDLDDLTTTTTAISYVRQGEEVWVETSHNVAMFSNGRQQDHFNGALLTAH